LILGHRPALRTSRAAVHLFEEVLPGLPSTLLPLLLAFLPAVLSTFLSAVPIPVPGTAALAMPVVLAPAASAHSLSISSCSLYTTA
jgi:hypothetical protein